ncbi:hypothetical protein Avbf_11861, partial [Armadillidium vulgare]
IESCKTLLVLPLENCVTRIRIKETEEDSDPRKRNEIIQCEAPLKPKSSFFKEYNLDMNTSTFEKCLDTILLKICK